MTSTDGGKFGSAKWTDTINALLANAEDPALDEATRQNYAAKAAVLMTKHGISAEQLQAAQNVNAPKPGQGAELWAYAVAGTHGLGRGRGSAVELIARAMGCKAAAQDNPSPLPVVVAIVGVPADLHALETLLPLIMRQAELAAASAAAAGQRATSYLAGFITGYGRAVAERITERRKEMIAETPGADIVLAARAQAVDQLYADRLGAHLTKGTANREHAAGARAGHAAGARADLGDARLGNTGQPALGG